MNDYTRKLLDKGIDSIEAAEALLDIHKSDFAASRAYYAMFYIAEALLNEKEMTFSKHSGVHAAFGQHFAKPQILDPKFHRWLMDAFDKRIAGDYGVDTNIEKEITTEMISQAREFLETAENYLQQP